MGKYQPPSIVIAGGYAGSRIIQYIVSHTSKSLRLLAVQTILNDRLDWLTAYPACTNGQKLYVLECTIGAYLLEVKQVKHWVEGLIVAKVSLDESSNG
eukprot:scaffold22650_cov95-Cylindrotheca_fusiformis.AAC.2